MKKKRKKYITQKRIDSFRRKVLFTFNPKTLDIKKIELQSVTAGVGNTYTDKYTSTL